MNLAIISFLLERQSTYATLQKVALRALAIVEVSTCIQLGMEDFLVMVENHCSILASQGSSLDVQVALIHITAHFVPSLTAEIVQSGRNTTST